MRDEKNLKELVELVQKAKNKELVEDLILGLTTLHEREVFAHRLEIVRRLQRGDQQHAIATDLGVGVSTVSRGAQELAAGRFKVLK